MILKETVSYYIKNQSSVFCTFLDASKAFDRVQYCKLFRLLGKRGLPACIVRILINLYTANEVRVVWAGLASDYFSVLNGVKQGGVISPILFCIYIDDLLIKLRMSGVGCFVGLNFTGALAYADDIVLMAPTPSAMRKLLAICDEYAAQYDIIFNADKSKFLVIAAHKRRSLYLSMCDCKFYIGSRVIDNVSMYSHLGHIITASFDDIDDIRHRRNSFIGQANNVLCCFSKVDLLIKLRLFKSYCSTAYGCELWALDNNGIDEFSIAWRKGLRRLLNLPHNTHSHLLPLLTGTVPSFDELCKRSARFITSCLLSPSQLVRSMAWHSVVVAKYNSILGSNALFCCERFGWSRDQFVLNLVNLSNNFFSDFYRSGLVDAERQNASLLLELLFLREGTFVLSNELRLTKEEICDIINCIATA
jgi:hypothetical protein